MPASKGNSARPSPRSRPTANAFGRRRELRDTGVEESGDAENNGDDAAQANEGDQNENGNADDDDAQNRDLGTGGLEAQDQIINVTPDQPIKLVITSTETKKAAKKDHPQSRITKFWSNFEPDYLGGITQILPDPVGERATASKKTDDSSLKVVHSYDSAKASCIKAVKRIVRECKGNNQKYTDPHFDLERDLKVTRNRDCLYGLTSCDRDLDPGDVKRVTDIFDHPQFFKDGAGFDDIVQGALGDCWFLAGLSAVTANQELLRKVCIIQDQDVGVYGFVFHRDGEWHPCIIDDKLYLSAPSFDESGDTVLGMYGVRQLDDEKVYQDLQQKGSKALYFARCSDENETWVPLLEKAFAKAHGDYMALSGGQVGEALEDLTGGVTTEIYTANILSKEDFWKDLCRIGKDFIFSCAVSWLSGWRVNGDYWTERERALRLKGIYPGHAYSVLATYEGYGQRLVKIRNPWAHNEWSGAWSDGSKEWTPEWLYRLEHKFGDDGVFWMTYEDMLKKYKYLDRTRLFGPEWFVAQEWTSVQVPWNCRDYLSTTFFIDVPEDTDAVVVLSQLDDRYFKGLEGQYAYNVSFRIQKFDEDEDEDDYFARSPQNYTLDRSTNVEVRLEKGKYTVLFKVEAEDYKRDDIETVIRENIGRKEKITQIATLYDLAFRKGAPPKTEEPKKEEPKQETPASTDKPAQETKQDEKKQPTPTPAPDPAPAPTPAPSTDEKKEEPKEEAKVEEKSEEKSKTEEKKEEVSEDKKDEAGGEKKEEVNGEKKEEKQEPVPAQQGPVEPPAVMSTPNAAQADTQVEAQAQAQIVVTTQTQQQTDPDDSDPNRNPWNASCVVGLRIYSKLSELKLKVLKPGDKPDGVTLDRDDIAKSALVEAEKAQEKQDEEKK